MYFTNPGKNTLRGVLHCMTEDDTFNALRKWEFEDLRVGFEAAVHADGVSAAYRNTGNVISGEKLWKQHYFNKSGWTYDEFCRAYANWVPL